MSEIEKVQRYIANPKSGKFPGGEEGGEGMNEELLMLRGNLDDIMGRLICCRALLDALREIVGVSTISEEALGGISNLLEMICRDFQADIDSAEKGVSA